MKKYQKLGTVLALGLGFSVVANGSTGSLVLYDNLSSPISGESGIPPGWIANAFSTGANCPDGCTLGDITLKLSGSNLDGSFQGIVLQLLDSTGVFADFNPDPLPIGAPGTPIGLSLINPSILTSVPGNNVFTPNGSIVLSANTSYWVKIDASAPNATNINWSSVHVSSDPGYWAYDTGFFGYHGDSGPFMMQVSATPILGASTVPVPAAAWLMGSGLIGLVSSWRRKKAV